MENNEGIWGILVIGVIIGFMLGYHFGIGNQSSRYGETGLPKNCRALIAENIKGFSIGSYTAEEALYSIDRNCGPLGSIWDER